MNKNKYTEILEKRLGSCGRMVSSSKSLYRKLHPKNLVVFNANIIINNEKVWYGDVDLTYDKDTLQEIAVLENIDIYILYEYSARFDSEESPLIDDFIIVYKSGGVSELNNKYSKCKEYYNI